VALVSYGTQFLRDEIELEDWYRHGVFFDTRLQFRDLDNALLADDFTLWLDILKASGATRLSLHPAKKVSIAPTRFRSGEEHVVIVHFAERHEIWVVATELPRWSKHALRSGARQVPDSTSWGGDLDTYWRVVDRPGTSDVADTDWPQLVAAIALDLDIVMPKVTSPPTPFCVAVPGDISWTKFPLFPVTEVSAQAHLLLAILDREEATFANETHPKNESSDYRQMSDADAAALMARGMRLRSWRIEVLLRCANEYRPSDLSEQSAPLVRLHEPPPGCERGAATAEADVGAQVAKPEGKWLGRIASVLAFAVLCLLVAALAKVIAWLPWLSVLIALPWVLYLKFRKDL
jgi:hypothetical protein